MTDKLTHTQIEPIYTTRQGSMFQGDCIELLRNSTLTKLKGKIDLILTSPPFPLNRKKKYGNFTGDKYISWLRDLAPTLREYLTSTGSIVLEIGNAWENGQPVMSTLPMRALLEFLEAANLHLCQEFVCFNPARLPSPAQWVTVERIRVKDAYTRVWWMSPTSRPKADNRRILSQYSKSMESLLKRGTYNPGKRPSEHTIGKRSFLIDNGGAIPPNVLVPSLETTENPDPLLINILPISNTRSNDPYQQYCRLHDLNVHPARMPTPLADFFIRFLTDEGDLVLDPFAGSNVTGAVAQALGRKWVAIEMDSEYIAGSRSRFPEN